MHPFLAARFSHQVRPLSLTVRAILLCFFVRVGHPYEINDLTDQIAEESSSVHSHLPFLELKEVNSSTSSELEWPSSTVTALPPTDAAISAQTDLESDHLKAILPRIKFTCKNKSEAYYSDSDFCDIFHYCKSNGFRYTFMCPNDSFYNNQLMACEQNATYLQICKAKATATRPETTTLAFISSTTSTAMPTTESSFEHKYIEPVFKSPLLRVQDVSNNENSISAAKFESIRLPSLVSSEAKTSTSTEGRLSTTTLIPPSLFIEPTLSNVILPEQTTIKASQLLTLLPSTTVATIEYANLSTTKLPFPISKSFNGSEQKGQKQPILHEAHTYQTSENKLSVKMNPAINFKKVSNKKHSNFNHILQDLDMSNYQLTTDRYPANYGHSRMMNSAQPHEQNLVDFALAEDRYHAVTLPPRKEIESGKLSLSIHKFFREGLPTNYWKSMPKLFRSMNAARDYETMHEYGAEPSMPRKNDHTGDHFDHKHSHQNPSSSPVTSMLSIPVLVPVNLSQDDYRRRMSASVLKPIVIPLREKGKLIPAYVLQFSGKWPRSRYKRSALNGKRLLSLSIKPNLLYQMIPSLLKIKSVSPTSSASSKNQQKAAPMAIKPPPLPTPFDLLMAAQGAAMPLYALPNGEMIPAHLLKYASSGYDLNDFTQFIPPYYFIEQNPPHPYKPVSFKKSPPYKRPPLRAKIPGSILNSTNINGTLPLFSTPPTGLLAVGSSPVGQKVSTPPSPLMYGTVQPPAHLSAYLENYTPVAYHSSYYSPLLNFGNSILNSDPSKFKPLFKKSNLGAKRKQKANSFLRSKEEKPSEPAPNITMPANIYVPDDILDDFQMETPVAPVASNNSTEQKNVDHKVTNDLVETLRSEESSPIRMFSRLSQSNQIANRYHRTMRDRLKQNPINQSHLERDLSSQARTNANFFNGTSAKSNSTTIIHKAQASSKGTGQHEKNPESSKLDGESNSYQGDNEASPAKDEFDSSAVNLTTFLRHLKASLAEIT